ncbi:MAG: hypothetical protein EHM89_14235 [Acidobacteria bacterium]|nr:MAG: hypothetical protein EHM89_14235 [Acidobacteriota bacterium]
MLPPAVWLIVGVLGSPAAPDTSKADLVVIEKATRTLKVIAAGREVAAFRVALGREPGQKECEGDNRTPEGSYAVIGRRANSSYHRALRLSYPSAADIVRASSKGCRPGGNIMIHGARNGLGWLGDRLTTTNWTSGCVALTDQEIERLWELVPDGTKVEIRP